MAVIGASRLTKHYTDAVAVEEVSLQVRRGEIYALLGLNGAGKTTLIRMLLGMIGPTSGSARIFEEVVVAGERGLWSRVGYLVEGPAAYPELTVRENLEVVRRLRRLPGRSAIDDIIDRLALGPYADRRARALSMGNLQRLALAKALVHRPDLLILDEPVNGLDPAGVVEIRNLLLDLTREQGVTVFLSSHLLTEVARLATRIGIIHRGSLLQEFNAEALDDRVRRRLIVTTRDNRSAADALATAGFIAADGARLVLTDERAVKRPDEVATLLVQANCPPTTLLVEEEDLETYFLRVVGAGDE